LINYHNKRFRAVQNSDNGQIAAGLVFQYQQEGEILTCDYAGGEIAKGHLIGIVDAESVIQMRYHQVDTSGRLMTGKCTSTPELIENRKIRLHEVWQWTSGDLSEGTSVLEEL
jgi:hypothetical protein